MRLPQLVVGQVSGVVGNVREERAEAVRAEQISRWVVDEPGRGRVVGRPGLEGGEGPVTFGDLLTRG
jgi:hypothetical protein